MKKHFFLLALLFAVAAPASATGQEEKPKAPADLNPEHVLLGFTLRGEIRTMAEQATDFLVKAVFQRKGQITASGTFTVNSQGQVAYSSLPADKLIVKYPNVPAIEYQIDLSKCQGYVKGTREDFLRMNFLLNYTVKIKGRVDLHLIASHNGNDQLFSMRGTVIHLKKTYKIDVKGSWISAADFDGYTTWPGQQPTRHEIGFEYNSSKKLIGTIRGEDFSLAINEASAFTALKSTTRYAGSATWLSGMGKGVLIVNQRHVMNNTWTVGGKKHKMAFYIKKAFRGGRPSELYFWKKSVGKLWVDGEPRGIIKAVHDKTKKAFVIMVVHKKGRIDLASFTVDF